MAVRTGLPGGYNLAGDAPAQLVKRAEERMAQQDVQGQQQQSITDKATQAATQTSGGSAAAGAAASGGFDAGDNTQDDSATMQTSADPAAPAVAAGLTPAVATSSQVCCTAMPSPLLKQTP